MVFRVPGSDAVATGAQQVGRLSADPAVLAAVRGTSAANGANFDMLLSYAAMESGLNPTARASTSSASGLYQFTEQTWLNAVREYGAAHGMGAEAALVTRQGGQLSGRGPAARQRILDLRNDPKVSTELATEHLRSLADKLTPVLGRPPDPAETYLGHFLGAGGATQGTAGIAGHAEPTGGRSSAGGGGGQPGDVLFTERNAADDEPVRAEHSRPRAADLCVAGRHNAGVGCVLPQRKQGRRAGGWRDRLGLLFTRTPRVHAATHVACDAGGGVHTHGPSGRAFAPTARLAAGSGLGAWLRGVTSSWG